MRVSGKAAWGYVPLPRAPGRCYLSVKHLGWTGTKGGAAVWSPEVFSLAVECFQCGTLSLSVLSFKGKRLFQQQESATNNIATHGPCWSCCRPPAPLPCVAACCQERIDIARRVRLCLCEVTGCTQSAVDIWLCRCGPCIFSLHYPLITVLQSIANVVYCTSKLKQRRSSPVSNDTFK